jgi:hypothetical protein
MVTKELNMNNIPSNFSLEEVIKFRNIPEEVLNLIYEALDNIEELEFIIEEQNHKLEIVEEQVYFRDNIINHITDCIKDMDKAAISNKDLNKLLDITWEYFLSIKNKG